MTRDIPWVSFILFLIAAVLLISGWRRAPRKLLPSVVTLVGIADRIALLLRADDSGVPPPFSNQYVVDPAEVTNVVREKYSATV